MRRRRSRLRLLVISGLGAALLFCALAERVRGARFLQQRLAALQAQGATLDVAQLRPPSVADTSNAWLPLIELTNLFTGTPTLPDPDWDAAGRLHPWHPDRRAGEGGTSNGPSVWLTIQRETGQRRAPLEQVREALARPDFASDFAYTNGFFEMPPEIVPLTRMGQAFYAEAAHQLHEGRGTESWEATQALLSTVRHMRRAPVLISHLSRKALVLHALKITGRLVAEGDLTESQLAALQGQWEACDFEAEFVDSLRMERALSQEHVRLIAGSRERQREILEADTRMAELLETEIPSRWKRWSRAYLQRPLWLLLWVDWDRGYTLDRWERFLAAHHTLVTEGWKSATLELVAMDIASGHFEKDDFEDLPRPGRWQRFRGFLAFKEEPIFSDSVLVQIPLMPEVARRLAITGLGVARYRRQHGQPPAALAQLVPDWIAAVPLDPIDLQPLRYRREGAETIIYSIGTDGEDGGGDAGLAANAGRSVFAGKDWAFPARLRSSEAQFAVAP